MRKFNLLILLVTFWSFCSAEKYEFEQIQLVAVENPISVTLSSDGLKMMVIDQPKKGFIQVKQCYRPYLESNWGAAVSVDPINRLINKDVRVEGFSYSYDGKYLYFAANFNGSFGGMDIYYCEILENGWSEPKNLGNIINSEADENFPSVSGNERTMFFTREVKIKKLEKFRTGELYKSDKDKVSNQWSEPEKINKQINSGGIAYPKIYDDNKTILYSSVKDEKEGWHIYWTKRLNDLHWYLPIRLDTLVSKNVEISPVYCKHDNFIYFIKYDDTGFTPKGELFRYKLDTQFRTEKTIKISGVIRNSITNEPVSAKVLVTDPVLGRIKFLTQSNIKGEYTTLLNADETYMFQVWDDKYSHVYQLKSGEETKNDQKVNFKIFPKVTVTVNIYDKEELWPLDAQIVVKDQSGNQVNAVDQFVFKGQRKFILPVGTDYLFHVSLKDYEANVLNLKLSNIILFNEFISDIELLKNKRELEIAVTDASTKNPLDAKVELIDQSGRKFLPVAVNGKTGFFKITLREGEAFDLDVRGPKGFAFKHTSFNLNEQRDLKTVNVELQPLTRKVPIRLNNINFESNSADLMESSFMELNRVVQLLKENPDIHVEIMAHTDDVGSDRFNTVLAEKRAKSVVEYLVVNRIAENRLKAKGYGETMPIVPNDSDENRAINRRVEMKILDENDADFLIEERITN